MIYFICIWIGIGLISSVIWFYYTAKMGSIIDKSMFLISVIIILFGVFSAMSLIAGYWIIKTNNDELRKNKGILDK